MALSQLTLVNTALLKLGAFKITALGDGSTEGDIAQALYTPVRDALLSAYPWSFATAQVSLTAPSATAPVADYAYAFSLPSDHLRTLSVGVGTGGSGVSFRQIGGMIQTDANAIVLTYIRRTEEISFPAYFDLVLLSRLAAEFCLPLTENATRAETLFRIAEQEYSRARTVDAQQDTPARLSRYSLVDVRG